MGKIPLMIYVEADVREWIRTKAFNNRTTMTSVVVDALRSQMPKDQTAKGVTLGTDAKRQRGKAIPKTALTVTK